MELQPVSWMMLISLIYIANALQISQDGEQVGSILCHSNLELINYFVPKDCNL